MMEDISLVPIEDIFSELIRRHKIFIFCGKLAFSKKSYNHACVHGKDILGSFGLIEMMDDLLDYQSLGKIPELQINPEENNH